MNGIVDDDKMAVLSSICPNGILTVVDEIVQLKQKMKGRGKSITATKNIQLQYKALMEKMEVYVQAVRNLLADQIRYIRDSKHQRVITEKNGMNALKLALQATQLSEQTSLD